MRTMNIFKTKVGGNFGLSFTDHRLPMVAGDVVEPFESRKMNETVSVDYFQSWTMILTLKIG